MDQQQNGQRQKGPQQNGSCQKDVLPLSLHSNSVQFCFDYTGLYSFVLCGASKIN